MESNRSKAISMNRVRELRVARELKQYDLAAELRVDQSTVARWERNVGSIPDEKKLALAELFGVSVEHLMGWDREQAA